jgi:undecaprenyl-diphosphatase
MWSLFHSADLWMSRKLNVDWTNAVLDRLLPTVTDFGAWTPVVAVIIIMAVIFGSTRLRLLCLAIGLGIAIGDSLVSKSLKGMTGRLRPHESAEGVANGIVKRTLPNWKPRVLAVFQAPLVSSAKAEKPGTRGKSFPSSHTINVCTVAMACWLVFGGRTWWVALIAALVAWSRIYCGSHWLSDILFSIPAGMFCGWLGVWAADCLWRRYGCRFCPLAFEKMPSLQHKSGV